MGGGASFSPILKTPDKSVDIIFNTQAFPGHPREAVGARWSKRPETKVFQNSTDMTANMMHFLPHSAFIMAICSSLMASWAGEVGEEGLQEHQFTETQRSSACGVRGGARRWAPRRQEPAESQRWKEGKSEREGKLFVRGVGQDLVCSGAQCV